MANTIYIELIKLIQFEEISSELEWHWDESIQKSVQRNVVKGTDIGKEKIIFELPLIEDVSVDVQSQFGSYGDMVPGLSNMIHLVSTLSASGGAVGEGILNLTNQLDAQRWDRTDPTRLTVKLGFFVKDKPYENVIYPVSTLVGMSILTYNAKDKNYSVPGINLKDMSNFTKKLGQSGNFVGSKFCSVLIPGIIYLPVAYIEKATPTYSKQVTENSYPLWATLELTFVSTFPALESDFKDTHPGSSKI
jgi:hypothetical protein